MNFWGKMAITFLVTYLIFKNTAATAEKDTEQEGSVDALSTLLL